MQKKVKLALFHKASSMQNFMKKKRFFAESAFFDETVFAETVFCRNGFLPKGLFDEAVTFDEIVLANQPASRSWTLTG